MIRKQARARGAHVRVTFSLPCGSTPDAVSVVGDFNGWAPGTHPLRKRGNGHRSASVELPRGTRSRFRYLSVDGRWFDDEDADEFEPNPHGGLDGVLLT